MQIGQERERSQDRRRNRGQRTENALQQYIYRHAELSTTGRREVAIGLLSVLPLLTVTILLTFILQHIVPDFIIESSVLFLTVSLAALWWGWGPALLLLFLGLVILDLFFITPFGQFTLLAWPNILQVLPFCLAGLVIGVLSLQRDRGWVRTQTYAHELVVARQQLEEAAQLKDRFLSMTSHELKTPLTAIFMQSQLLQRRLKRNAIETNAVLQALERIDERTHFITSMVDELQDLSLIQSHRMALEREPHDMNTLCQKVMEDQRLVTGRTILFQPSVTPATVLGDHSRLTQVVSNLVSNAIKYSPLSSPVEVSVYQDTQHVIVQVRDYGQGIAQDQREHIFEPFYRTSEAQSSATEGLGLGLAIAKQIIDLHEGRIWYASEWGGGSTFCVELPARS